MDLSRNVPKCLCLLQVNTQDSDMGQQGFFTFTFTYILITHHQEQITTLDNHLGTVNHVTCLLLAETGGYLYASSNKKVVPIYSAMWTEEGRQFQVIGELD